MPEKICGSKKKVFSYVQERLNNRINGWSGKLLSKGGKEVQIKAVAQAIPSYTMSCYLLPQDTCQKLSAAVARFWWGARNNNRGLHWVAWDKICVPLEEGGLGFRNFRDFNLALLAKQVWRLLVYPQSLLARVLKGRYFRHSNPMITGKANNASLGWNSLMSAKHILQDGLRRTIDTGNDTKVWEDLWIPTENARPAKPRSGILDNGLRVHHLIDFARKEWNKDMLNELVAAEDIPRILSLKISRTGRKDSYTWDHTNSGTYTVRAGYKIATEQRCRPQTAEFGEPSTTGLKKEIWKLKAPRKIKHFLWSALSGYVASASKLKERHCGTDATCQRCGAEKETINLILFECPPAMQCWALSSVPTTPGVFPCFSIYTNVDILLGFTKDPRLQGANVSMFPWLMWYIWKARNELCFNAKNVTPMDTIQLARHEAETWAVAQIVEEGLEEERVQVEAGTNPAPTEGSVPAIKWKCHFDASWKSETEGAGVGFVLLEEERVILFGCRKLLRAQSPLQAEAEGLCWTMKEMIHHGFHHVSFESDCQQLVCILHNTTPWPALEPELDEIDSLRLEFSEFSLSYVSRLENIRADCLAKASRSRSLPFSFVDVKAPHWLVHEACMYEPLRV